MVRCGVVVFVTDKSMQPIEIARAVEERGLDSMFVPEHTHIPTESVSPFMAGEIPEHYRRTYDPFVTLGACAAVTERILIGTGICLVTQRHPITLAKELMIVPLEDSQPIMAPVEPLSPILSTFPLTVTLEIRVFWLLIPMSAPRLPNP